jgi:hypothetical protein
MHILEQRDTLVLTNGNGSPRRSIVLQALFALPISIAILTTHLSAAMNGWEWGWLALLIVPIWIFALVRAWRQQCHATLEIDRRFGRVRLERRFATRTEEEKLALGDVAALEVETATDSDGERSYAPVLALKDGRRIVLGPKRLDRASVHRAAEAVRSAL